MAYTWPEDFLLPLSVALAGRPLGSADLETVRQYERGDLVLQDRAVWYEAPDDSGLRKLTLYPSPSGGDTLELEWVYEGAALKPEQPTDEPGEFPRWFHPKLVHFAAESYYATIEDNPELAQVSKEQADLAVSELIRYDNERGSGSGVFQIGIVGVTA